MLLLASMSTAGASAARAAKTLALSETASLRLTSHHNFTLNERGSASGTIKGTIYIHLTLASTNRVSAEVNIYPSGGSLSGSASASYRVAGPTASFSGSMTVTHGSGRYAHAHGSGLSFSGTIRRSDDAITVRLGGQISQ
jgi:hypothetical protein